SSAATGEIVYRLLSHLGQNNFTTEAARALYTAIMTDTGSFRFPKTGPEIHRQVAHLLECGADPVAIYQQVYEQGSAGRLQLLGRALASLQTAHSGKVACMTVTRQMFQETGTSEEDTDNVINYTLTVKGVQVGLLFTELNEGMKISFRSKGNIWINKLAQEFGGNGHQHAAGARVPGGTVNELLPKVLERSKSYLNE
ncbi:MAG: DHH family phosphoesterase, partial [Bacteroidota bacterium]